MCPNRFKYLGVKFEGRGVPGIWRESSCLDGQELEIQKSELLEQNFCLQPPEQRSRLTKIKKPYESLVEKSNYVGHYCDCNISKLQLMKCQPIVIMFYGSRSTESCD